MKWRDKLRLAILRWLREDVVLPDFGAVAEESVNNYVDSQLEFYTVKIIEDIFFCDDEKRKFFIDKSRARMRVKNAIINIVREELEANHLPRLDKLDQS